ncbi:acyl carrier protein [Nonomuraea sp. NPDC048882]|uniref:acyl carrier protein n=1 Tax=Nonomuraea sp. NPDC048882 TaxID=3154347 RepID=UPI0033C28D4C
MDLMEFLRQGGSEVTGRDLPSLTRADDLQELGIDSIQALELIAWVEEQLGIRIPDEELVQVMTIFDLCAVIERRLPEPDVTR